MTDDKPYGYVRADGEGLFIYGEHALQNPHGVEMVPVYRRQHREWVGLTDEEYLSKAYRLANELKCHLAIAPATQPAQTPWVGLTDAEVFELFRHEGTADSDINPLKLLADARRIEAKLKEKNT